MSLPIIALCIPTFRRPELLQKCLMSLSKLQTPEGTSIEVFVADNDSEKSAEKVCLSTINGFSFPLHYLVESDRGLSTVRNRLLKEALKCNADYIAFIDDDEEACPDWLKRLHSSLIQFSADVATGPVEARGKTGLASKSKTLVSGASPRHVSTNNVMFTSSLINEQGLGFDPYFNFIGGEDFEFFQRSSENGNRHVWVQEAKVFEWVVDDRDSLRYVFYRHFTGGINSILRYRKTLPAWRAWLHFIPKVAGKIFGCLLHLIFALITLNKNNFILAVKKFANSCGYLAGLLNIIVERYRYGGSSSSAKS